MFNFSTTTLINSDKDFRSERARFSALAAEEGKHGAILKIKRDFTFEMPGIKKVYKKVAADAVRAEVTVDCGKLIDALPTKAVYPVVGRIALYVALEGSEESVFANDWYQKGHPFSVGFVIRDEAVTGSELAAAVKKAAVKYNIATVGRRLFDVSVEGAVVTFKCTDEYMRFKAVAVLADHGDHEHEVAHLFDGESAEANPQDVIALVERGTNSFGTFRHLVKDLRLPTAQNTSWTALQQTERPVPGAKYDQFTLYYVAPSFTNPSMVAVGHKTMTHTTHTFWVRQDFSEAFEGVLTEVLGSGPVKDDPTAIFEEV